MNLKKILMLFGGFTFVGIAVTFSKFLEICMQTAKALWIGLKSIPELLTSNWYIALLILGVIAIIYLSRTPYEMPTRGDG